MHHLSLPQPRHLRRCRCRSPLTRAPSPGTLRLSTLVVSLTWINRLSTLCSPRSSHKGSVNFQRKPLHAVHRRRSHRCITSPALPVQCHSRTSSAGQVFQIHTLRYDASAVRSLKPRATVTTISRECNRSNSGALVRQHLHCSLHSRPHGAILTILIRPLAAHPLLPCLPEAKPHCYHRLHRVRIRN